MDALPEVITAVDGKVPVFIDGGVRHGMDVLKALALGARAAFIGRPVLWGLAYQVGLFMYVRAIFRYMEPVKRPAAGYKILVLSAEYRKVVLTERFALKVKSVLRGI